MTKSLLIPFSMAGLLADKAVADCLPAEYTPASVIQYFQKFNKPLRGNAMASEQRLSLNLAEWNSFRCYSGKDARPNSAAIRERDRGIRAPNDAGRQRRAALAV